MDKDQLAALDRAARDEGYHYSYRSQCETQMGRLLVNAYRTGNLVLIGPDDVATVGMALCQSALGPKACPCVEKGEFRCADAHPGDQARAALAALETDHGG